MIRIMLRIYLKEMMMSIPVHCRPETFEMLAYSLTVEKLVEAFGYPEVAFPILTTLSSHQ